MLLKLGQINKLNLLGCYEINRYCAIFKTIVLWDKCIL